MNAVRAEVLPEFRVESHARFRPELRVVYRAESPMPAAPSPGHSAPLRSAPLRSAPLRSAPLRSAPLRSAPLRSAPVRTVPASPSRVPARPATSPLRLTRRGRVVVAAMAALLVAVVSLIAAGAAQATSHSAPRLAAGHNLTQAVVRPGQSLWSVAESADPDADTRLVIQQIVQLNSLNGDIVFAGQRLWVPRG
jgi:hypothetical protein